MTSPTPNRWQQFLHWLAHGWWAGIAGLLTVIGLAIGIFTACAPQEPPAAPGNQIIGDCNAQGASNSVSCR